MEKLLIVDDNEEIRKQLQWGLKKEYSILCAEDAPDAVSKFAKHKPRVVLLDLGLPPDPDGTDEGMKCLGDLLGAAPGVKVIVVTGKGEKENATRAVSLGAYDFYSKPVNLDELKVILRRAFHLAGIEEENRSLQLARAQKSSFGQLIGNCRQMQDVFTVVEKVARSEVPALILGDSGTGKELVARAIHAKSSRREGPFIPINCSAIPENLLETELFGHEKGSFTGAGARVLGKVEYAQGGTLFLDEIGDLPAQLQVKLLRFLQDGVIQRVGGREFISTDVRIVAATNRDIDQAIASGKFREDLYYRIGVITIRLPSLREREGDVMLLANYFLHRFAKEFEKKIKGFSASAVDALTTHDWPGNVRELENKVKRSVIMADTPLVTPGDLGFAGWVQPPKEEGSDAAGTVTTLKEAREKAEIRLITSAIEARQGNIVKIAEDLGVSRPTLYDLLKKHGLRIGTPPKEQS